MTFIPKIAVASGFAFFLAACSLHRPQPVDLPMALPENFVESQGQIQTGDSMTEWWKIFDNTELDALIQEAFSRNYDIRRAFARLEQARTAVKSAASAQRPFLSADGQVSRESQPSFAGDSTGNNYRLSASAGYEIDLWRKLASRTDAARFEEKASHEDIKTLFIGLSSQTADLYYLAVELRAQIALAERTIASFQETLDRVERRYREGLAPAIDVYQARQNLSGARARRSSLESSLAAAEHGLSIIVGKYPDGTSAGTLAIIPEVSAAFPAGIPSDILATRPDIHAAFLRLKASDSRIAAAIADRFPSFNFLGSYGSSSTSFPTGDISGIFWNLLLKLAAPVLDGGRRSAEVERTRAVFRENLAVYHKTVLAAFGEVEDALASNRSAEERFLHMSDQVDASVAAYRLASERYYQGLTDYVPVLLAQQLLYNSESALLSEKRQLISGRIQLARALGGRWAENVFDHYYSSYTGRESDHEPEE